jgi:hypothetical protein
MEPRLRRDRSELLRGCPYDEYGNSYHHRHRRNAPFVPSSDPVLLLLQYCFTRALHVRETLFHEKFGLGGFGVAINWNYYVPWPYAMPGILGIWRRLSSRSKVQDFGKKALKWKKILERGSR